MAQHPVALNLRSSVRSLRLVRRPVPPAMCALAIAAALAGACSSNPGSGDTGSGGTTGTGGASTGGTPGTGGSSNGTGGRTTGTGGSGTGGSIPGTGGSGTGGSGTGGSGTGGSGTGGSGGKTGTGGSGTGGSATGGTGAGGSSVAGSSGGGTGGSGASAGGSSGAAVYNPNFVEFYGSDCTVAAPTDVSISGQLPNLFTKLDGTTMAKRSDWKCRRAEMKAVVEKYIFGPKPGAPDMVTGSVSSTAIKVHAVLGSKSIDFSVPISIPSGAKMPAPIIIGLGGSSLDPGTVSAEGVATGTYDNQGMMSESSRTGLFTTLYGTSTGASSQIGWAWGFSRVIDVLVSEKAAGRNNIIDPTAVAVTGCSRDGKGAFTVGAFDERIALGIPQESGTAGVSAMRIVNTQPKGPNGNPAQSLSNAVSTEVGWFGSTFESTYINKVDTIPGDTHSLAAMHAPRGLLVLDNSRIGELCATCQHAATDAAQVVYQALGIGANVGYNGGNPTDPQNHCTFYPTTQGPPLQRAIRGHLTKTAAPDGRMEPQPAGTADLTKWVPWSTTAPTLTSDVSWASPPLTSQ
jgi:hypothetical protein